MGFNAATFEHYLLRAAQRQKSIVMSTLDAGQVVGVVDVVGDDYVLITEDDGAQIAIRISRVTAIEFTGSKSDTLGHVDNWQSVSGFHDLIRLYALQHRMVSIGTASRGDSFVGRLWSCGIDSCVLRLHGTQLRFLPLQLTAISYVYIWSEHARLFAG